MKGTQCENNVTFTDLNLEIMTHLGISIWKSDTFKLITITNFPIEKYLSKSLRYIFEIRITFNTTYQFSSNYSRVLLMYYD